MNGGLRRFPAAVFLLAFVWMAVPAVLPAQTTMRVRASEENFRKDPRGTKLATVLRGTELQVLAEQGDWVEVELQGWIWGASVGAANRDGFDLSVRADGSENLRAAPQGRILARLLEGCLLERTGTSGNWVQVRRRGWLWKASLEATQSAGGAATPGPAAEPATADSGPPPVISAPPELVVYSTPDGDTVAEFRAGAQAQVLGRTGDWIRVRMDGWVYGPAALDSAQQLDDTGDVTPAQLRADPGRYKGALVRWRVQVISLRRAERARSDFAEGEPFIHARGPAGDAGFVYLAVPSELLPLAERLQPLEFVTVVGRVRTGRSSLLGSPVIDLTDIETQRPQG